MTGPELKAAREEMRLSVNDMARALGYANIENANTLIRRYERGEREIPGWIPRLVDMYLRYGVPEEFLAP